VTRRILVSTTSHKREPLLSTLEVFGRLGMLDLDLNLHHFIEEGLAVEQAASAVAAHRQTVWVASGGWCDFFHEAPEVEDTFASVGRQVRIAQRLGAGILRLFFGRLPRASYGQAVEETIVGNLRRLSDCHEATTFIFENHDGASLVPEICRDVLARVDRPNIRMNFDPVNFARGGIEPATALTVVQPLIAHVHLKGLDRGEFCEFGAGDLDLAPLLRRLLQQGYGGYFTVEYEGPCDGTLRLYRSVEKARTVIASLG